MQICISLMYRKLDVHKSKQLDEPEVSFNCGYVPKSEPFHFICVNNDTRSKLTVHAVSMLTFNLELLDNLVLDVLILSLVSFQRQSRVKQRPYQ